MKDPWPSYALGMQQNIWGFTLTWSAFKNNKKIKSAILTQDVCYEQYNLKVFSCLVSDKH